MSKITELYNTDVFNVLQNIKHNTVFPHVCNDKYVMGAGIALQIKTKFPHVYQQYTHYKPTLGQTQVIQVQPKLYIVNMVAQTLESNYNEDIPLNYNKLIICMRKVLEWCKLNNCTRIVTVPFGTGLAEGDPGIIKYLIEEYWCKKNLDVTMCVL